jgi:5-methylcytosine-specific restriction endonuclease McrA
MNTGAKHNLKDWAYRKYRGKCAYCDTKLLKHEATLDHIVPKRLGGTNRKENIALCCVGCNQTKGSMTPQAWRCEVALGVLK